MHPFLKNAGIAALIIAMVAGYREFKFYVAEKSTKPVVTEMVRAITAGWDIALFKKYAEAGPVNGETGGKTLTESIAEWQKLGKLQSGVNCELQNVSSYGSGAEHYDSAIYLCAARYEHGPATLTITLRRYGNDKAGWKINYFAVNRSASAPSAP